jgi:release factor glutamine methyltransferase
MMAETVWTIGSLLRWTAEHFAKKGLESPRLDAEVLLAHVLNCRRIELYTRSEELAGSDVRTRFRALVERRLAGCPVAYLVGKKEFFLLSFEVTPAVLIPRPATETLVLAALERLKATESPRILDIGAGSGCIAISLASRLKSARFVASDVTADALELARRNAERNHVADRIDFRQGADYAPIAGEQFHAIVTNPPYVPTAEIAALAVDVRDHEPRAALDGGPEGLDIIRRLIERAPDHLTLGGWLVMEFGMGQSTAIVALAGQKVEFAPATIILDGDGIPRVLAVQRLRS